MMKPISKHEFMKKNTKQHTRDYLVEYQARKEIPCWLVLLIQKTIDAKAKISETDKDEIYMELLRENKIDIEQSPANSKDKSSLNKAETIKVSAMQKLTLQKITHIKGVNALIPSQAFILSPACSVIFGLNGTGKSGYFRIIHELAGGAKLKDILDNIHRQSDGLEVDIDFSLDDQIQNQYKWLDKTARGVVPFNQIRVFDSEYLPIFLNERETSVNVEPLGLNLFQEITSIIDEFKGRLDQSRQQKINHRPDLQSLIDIVHSHDLKILFQKVTLSEQEKEQLVENGSFQGKDSTKLAQLKQDKIFLEKNNVEDSRKVVTQEKKEINDLKIHLLMLQSRLKELTEDITFAIVDFLEKKKIRNEKVKQFEILKNIPSQDSEEWQLFIDSANAYNTTIAPSSFNKNKKCIYCHQPLSTEAVKIIQAYAQYSADQSLQNFKKTSEEIGDQKTKIDNLVTDFSFSENLTKSLAEIINSHNLDNKILVDQVLAEAKKHKLFLAEALQDKTIVSKKFVLDLLKTDETLGELLGKKLKELDILQQSDAKKVHRIQSLEKDIHNLEDSKNISIWKNKIDNYFLDCLAVKKYGDTIQNISTRGITELGSKAHDELLTDSIKESFEGELRALGKDIEVGLEKTSAGKGTVRTRLKILGKDVRDILSDGEQKSVGLALFLAEVECQDNHSPVVFDDPVTSVDHEVAHLLAQKLISLSADRQIVIFTHNKLFYDSLVYWGNNLKDALDNKTHHICKDYTQNGCSAKGHHVYTYRVDKVAKDRTGKIFEYQNESCEYFIKKAENEMKSNYTPGCVSSYLKLAIEYYIDEKILNNQCLMKDRKITVNINWPEIKKINIDVKKIEQLHIYYGQLSDKGTHLTQNSELTPLGDQELRNIITFLRDK